MFYVLKFGLIAIYIILLASLGHVAYGQMNTRPCSVPLAYSIGTIDPEFNLSQDKFLTVINEAVALWEQAAQRPLFIHDSEAEFKINLIFDERQQRTNEESHLRQQLTQENATFEALSAQYNQLAQEYEQRLNEYNQEVKYWNDRGGAPSDQYHQLNNERQALNKIAQDLNALGQKLNQLAKQYNLTADLYNTRFGESYAFDQGEFKKNEKRKEINIYQFKELNDLLIVTAHELGHALGMGHVENPKSIMYHMMNEQKQDNPTLTHEDKQALFEACNLQYNENGEVVKIKFWDKYRPAFLKDWGQAIKNFFSIPLAS